jgi:uncharacterized protein (DUF1778 family)
LGRHPRAEARGTAVSFHLSPVEQFIVKRAAARQHQTLSSFIRDALFGHIDALCGDLQDDDPEDRPQSRQ